MIINEFAVAACLTQPKTIRILAPPVENLSHDRALALAAWIVAIVNDRERFDRLLAEVEAT